MPKPRTRLKHQLFKSQARTAACSILANALPTQSGEAIVFRPIDALALDAFNGWGDGVHFSWEEVPLWKAREPWSFDLSIWCGSELCGLCFANPNQSRLRTKIIRLEGNPDIRHPLKNRVAAVAMLAVEHYAQKVGSRWLEIQEPAQEAMKVYQELGFKFDAFGRLVIDLKKVEHHLRCTINNQNGGDMPVTTPTPASPKSKPHSESKPRGATTSATQQRFLRVAVNGSKADEPSGVLAGSPL